VKAPPEILLPSAIVAERDRLISWSYFMRAWRPILDRLCNATTEAEKKRPADSIWKQLNRRSPVIARPQLIEQSPKWCMGGVPDEKWSDRDIALQVVFLNSFSLAVSGEETITAAEKKRLVDSYRERARRLRNEASGLRNEAALYRGMGELSEAAEHGQAIVRAAAWCEAEAEEIFRDEMLVVSRHQGAPQVRAYCTRLAEVTRLVYGDVSRGAVAAIATAALDYKVTIPNVRYWCENKTA
jgi:hypothetical protein